MDTTSHNFTWQTFTFGENSSSVLYDVAIIDENNIWAVGEIYLNDSLGQPDPKRYNAAIWNGNNWSIQRVPYYYQGQPFYHPIQSVFAFGPNGTIVNSVIHWDGTQFNEVPISVWGPYQMNKIWGTSSSDLYIVGNNGNIAWYNGARWTRIESGTELNINDIWGDYNNKTGAWEILAVASNIFSGFEKEVIKIGESSTQILNKDGIDEPLGGVWFKSNKKYYVVGSGTYEKNNLNDVIWIGDPLDITEYFENSIRANEINNVFVVGAFGEVLHFNGVRWKSYLNEIGVFNGAYLSIPDFQPNEIKK